jgi:hypothetical protein
MPPHRLRLPALKLGTNLPRTPPTRRFQSIREDVRQQRLQSRLHRM